ncbi:MAG TPA: hypothetical protein VH701_23825 [Vicinamibacterales bacterium]|jgi:hypothetical protein
MKSFSQVHWSSTDAAWHPTYRWNAASGYLVIGLGIAGAAFERGSPPFTAPVEEVVAFWTTYQRELLAQSMMFVLSAGAYLWFFGSLRTVLMRAEGSTGTLSTIAFGAGIVSAGLQMILQCFQVALAVAAAGALERGVVALFGGLGWALSVIAYVPMGVMLGAVAIVSFAYHAFPYWLAWFSLATSLAHFVMTLGLVVKTGPLVPGQTTTYALYAIALLWLIATTTVMVFGIHRPPKPDSTDGTR